MPDQAETTDDVIVDGQPEVKNEEAKVETTETQTPTGDVTTEETKVETPESKDDFWKNRSYELERKLGNLTTDLPKIIEETLTKQSTKQEQKQEYTVAQLEAYALEHPEHRPWVEEQKAELIEKKFEQKLQLADSKRQQEHMRAQSVQTVFSDPKFSDMFVTLPTGQKAFNPQSEMARLTEQYLADPRIKGQPDELLVAAKLARADYIDRTVATKEQNLNSLKRQNAQLKQKTMVEGTGSNDVKPVKSSYEAAKENLAKSGSRKDAEAAVAEYLKLRG